MIIISKRVGQVSSNQPPGGKICGRQDSHLIIVLRALLSFVKAP